MEASLGAVYGGAEYATPVLLPCHRREQPAAAHRDRAVPHHPPSMTDASSGDPLPLLPEHLPPERLRDMDDASLDAASAAVSAAERAVAAAMAPYERQQRELRARAAEIATERRRRDRAQRHAARVAVREQAGTEAMPSLVDALAAIAPVITEERPLRDVRAFLRTGGEVGFGYPTRPGAIAFTDGRRTTQATTFGEARRLYSEGWEPGAPGLAGVRVHLVGTRIERLVAPDEVVVEKG